jgi:hypothetical protein
MDDAPAFAVPECQIAAEPGLPPAPERRYAEGMPATTVAKDFLASRLDREQIQRLKTFQALRLRRTQAVLWRVLFGTRLNMLATVYNSDKWNSHWYTQHYQTHFAPLRRRELTLLEIGVGGYDDPMQGGDSLRMWRAYLPKARIYGIDIHDKRVHDEQRIKTFQGSQADPAFLDRVLDEIGTPDIIIDDGSHQNAHVLATFEFMFPKLADDGMYVIEDTQTSYWPNYGGSSEDLDRHDTTMGLVKRLADGLNHQELLLPDYVPSYADLHVVALHCYHNLVFVQKGRNDERPNISVREAGVPAV